MYKKATGVAMWNSYIHTSHPTQQWRCWHPSHTYPCPLHSHLPWYTTPLCTCILRTTNPSIQDKSNVKVSCWYSWEHSPLSESSNSCTHCSQELMKAMKQFISFCCNSYCNSVVLTTHKLVSLSLSIYIYIIWWVRRQYGWILYECVAVFS